MTILNVNETNLATTRIVDFSTPIPQSVEAPAILPASRGAGQRRLRAEMACAPMLKAVNERPADDLQKVYEQFERRASVYKQYRRVEDFCAGIGDIESMKVLIKYGLNVVKSEGLMFYAIGDSRHAMVRFLADNGAVVTTDMWLKVASKAENYIECDKNLHRVEGWRYSNMSEEWLMTLEYLLDRGTKVNPEYNRPLAWVIQMQARDGAEQAYKDRLIKMLVDRGAKL